VFRVLVKAPKDIEKGYEFSVGHIAQLVRSQLKNDGEMFNVLASILIVPVLFVSRELRKN